ncbi:MAG: hypothetical protein IJK31_04450 [Ruminococcus sp.]|nr:hypothetical protein [Ruminococcus sp.]HRR75767.1 hypothetical protein [Ruminococcus sp.]
MYNIRRRIISGAVLSGCALLTIFASSRITEKAGRNALPVAMTDMSSETPTIILDAGHGGSY